MSNKDNARRGEKKRTEHGPRFETHECDAPSVAHARKSWKAYKNRTERRTGKVGPKYHPMKPGGGMNRMRPKDDSELCVYCGGHAQGNYTIHRDGFGIGPEVPLCDACGGEPTPTLTAIWARIRERRKS